MSNLIKDVAAVAAPQLEELGKGLASDFADGMEEILNAAPQAAKDKVLEILKEGAAFKAKALTADDAEQARQYAEAVETSVRRFNTVLKAERLVAEDSFANTLSALWDKALSGLASIAQGLLGVIVKGITQGAIAGFTGGEGGDKDLASIFPFA